MHAGRSILEKPIGAFEFHVSARARDFYRFDLSLFSLSGNVILADFQAARRFAQAINAKRDLLRHPEQAVQASQINAMGLIDEMLHLLVRQYAEEHPGIMQQALFALATRLGSEGLEATLRAFAREFPPLRVYRGEISLADYLEGHSEGRPNREILLEEMLLLWMANANPAFAPFLELFDDTPLEQNSLYLPAIEALEAFFEGQPPLGQSGLSLFKTLRLPALLHPHSLEAQLGFLLQRYGHLGILHYRLLVALDVIREEKRSFAVPVSLDPPKGAGQSGLLEWPRLLQAQEAEPEAFSPDLDWMPRCVLIAKNTYVWLDQLSKKYGRAIRTLEQIPEEELAILQDWGITGLWLIGVWERSPASQRIKQLTGNPEAAASAYALYDYTIARELGGELALQALKEKAARYGIRLGADMVPNHVGIDGRWVIEHPDWFIQLPYPPYPSYTFNGPDVSSDARVGIYLEDHYYDRSDAAVVFKWVDRQSGQVRYIYHGNDGTAMPWNDTAQLDYLKPEVREAVIQTILRVAQQFPILRFDAAMTLTKRHFQRLWYPEPGGSPWGPAIPSRAEHALTKEAFDAAMPLEFWREVVDRAAQEAPQTLLLAEAFWMMEGYFVRSLGMHRVYNSAFMNMLRDEKNAEYRQIMKNTLEFEPEILKRFVNFLSNPDEKTAVEQFGKGDKYFGVMTLCATLPGLPMLGHGQVEGLTERYGMEYRRAYYEEKPDEGFVAYHQQQIFPLLKKRHLFAEVEHFVLYEAQTEGGVDENVFVYSNRAGLERALVAYHNQNAHTQVWVRRSVMQLHKTPTGRETRQVGLGQGLGLSTEADTFSIFRDLVTGLEYLYPNRRLHEEGLYLELGPYQRRVFLDWREVRDPDGSYARLAQQLGGRGVPSLEEARQAVWFEPLHLPLRALVGLLLAHPSPKSGLGEGLREGLWSLYHAIEKQAPTPLSLPPAEQVLARLERVLAASPHDDRTTRAGLVAWALSYDLGQAGLEGGRLGRALERALVEAGLEPTQAQQALSLARLLLAQQEPPEPSRLLQELPQRLQDPETQRFLQIHRFGQTVYFNREAHLCWLRGLRAVSLALASRRQSRAWSALITRLEQAAEAAGYGLESYLEQAMRKPRRRPASRKSPKPARKRKDDLTQIKGIGPKIAAALQAAGITTFARLAQADPSTLRTALAAAGLRPAPRLETWPQQAAAKLAEGKSPSRKG